MSVDSRHSSCFHGSHMQLNHVRVQIRPVHMSHKCTERCWFKSSQLQEPNNCDTRFLLKIAAAFPICSLCVLCVSHQHELFRLCPQLRFAECSVHQAGRVCCPSCLLYCMGDQGDRKDLLLQKTYKSARCRRIPWVASKLQLLKKWHHL